ncbi:acyl-CoA dehydrogenase [Zoogloea dura]|uniref:3-methylmercaptopropionyl-CoA dehydrogenase n=1 Tax=Zoogloea dura TaxID=2728840 RepID=A0A848G8F8_9RHOO|nr:acyl-CoA dehydrogenase [Zoogloea dura]NML28568.1 acyl-CoA dehydrogenase [Zoogloea dura]
MSDYRAPLADMRFVMNELAGLGELSGQLACFSESTPDMAEAILREAARFAEEVLAPLNRRGDMDGCTLAEAEVSTPAGWKEAYRALCEGGWGSINLPAEHGGHGQPEAIGVAVKEMMFAANLSFSLAPLLTLGAVEALLACAGPEVKAAYLARMVSGEWSGTMNLTEPQAGSDLALIRTRAEPHPDGSHRLFGQKIFITYGDHDLCSNIVHLVLARLPDAPPGVRGISMFLVPKRLVNGDGTLGAHNDVRCVSLEHKLGIHASPTCVMAYGDGGGAVGYLLGRPNRGLEYMFIMMNVARLAVGLQGIALGERAWQQARAYAAERRQGRDALSGAAAVCIDRHPDVRRMLMLMRCQVEACRAVAYVTAAQLDRAQAHPDAAERARQLALAEFMIPIVKAGGSEMGVEVTSLGIQVHGGMGFIEETGAAQFWRDARITTIYEGTTGIQANDLILRKLLRDDGAVARDLSGQIGTVVDRLTASPRPDLQRLGTRLRSALEAWTRATDWVLAQAGPNLAGVLTAAVPYLQLAVSLCGGWQMGRAALAAATKLADPEADRAFLNSKLASACFYADHVLPRAIACAGTVQACDADSIRLMAHDWENDDDK